MTWRRTVVKYEMDHIETPARQYRVESYFSTRRLLMCSGVLAFALGGYPAYAQTSGAAPRDPATMSRQESPTRDQSTQRSKAQQQPRRVSLTVRDSSLAKILQMLTNQAGVGLVYNVKDPRFQQPVTLTVVNLNIEAAVQKALQGTGLNAAFASDGETIVIRSPNQGEAPDTAAQATGGVMVRVLDSASGQRLSGVTVSVAGTRISGTTDSKGELRLQNVPTGEQRLVFRMFGYQSATRTVQVNKTSSVSVVSALVAVPTTLTGVVTTTTGTQRKMEIGNAITTINVDSVMRVAPVSTLTDLLENRVTGLTVLRGSGQPGDPSRIRLRGSSSINNSNDMIIVVDGIRVESELKAFGAKSYGTATVGGGYLATSPIDLIDPNSIETIDVFKGPSAAAMYGSDAANGVIVIMTKRGRPGTTDVTGTARYGTNYMPGSYPDGSYAFGYFDNSLGGEAYGRCRIRDTWTYCRVDSVVKYQALNDPYYTVIGRGHSENYSSTVSGGSNTVQYSFTGSTSSETGLLKMSTYLKDRYRAIRSSEIPSWIQRPDLFETWNGTGKLTAQIRPMMRLSVTTDVSKTGQRKTALGNNAISYWMTKFIGDTLVEREDRFYERATRNMISYSNSLRFEWTVWKQADIDVTGGLNATNLIDETYLPEGFQGALEDFGKASNAREWTQNRTLNSNVRFPMWNNRLTLIVGGSYTGRSLNRFKGDTDSLPKGISRPGRFTSNTNTSSSMTTRGWYVEPRFNNRSRFFIMPGFRLDHNGLSGSRAGGLPLPKLNTSWVISDEEFFPWKQQVDVLRIRLAGGFAGTQPGITDRLRMLRDLQTYDIADTSYRSAVSYASLGNTKLQPERSREIEGGLDLDFWKGRASVVFTYYQKIRRDAIEAVDVPPSAYLGSSGFAQNIGTVQNTGTELEVRLTPMESRRLAWSTTATIAQNRNQVTRLRVGILSFTRADRLVDGAATKRVVEGYPLWGVWARPLLGFHDTDNDGRITSDEITLADSAVYLGQPDEKGGVTWSNDFRVFSGRININIMMSYKWGMLQTSEVMRDQNSPFNTAVNTVNPSLVQQALMRAVSLTVHPVAQTVDMFRFETLSIRYMMPRHLVQKLGGRTMSVALQGSNLGLKSNYIGKDPNVGSVLLMSGATIDTGLLSQPRKWQLQVQWGSN